MAFRHGKDTSVLIGKYNLTAWLNSATASRTLDTAETSFFGGQAKTYLAGQDDGTFSFEGLYDGVKADLEDKVTEILAAPAGVAITTSTDGALVVGRRATIGVGLKTTWEISSPFNDVVSSSGEYQCSGPTRSGVVLGNLTPFSTTTTYASVDGTAATANGLLAALHVIDNSQTSDFTVVVQHSANNSTWVDLLTFNVTAGTEGSQTAESSGSVSRYLRAVATLAGTGNITILASAARK